MTLPFGSNLFPRRGEQLISYDYFDISNGTGYDIYYGASVDNGEYAVLTTFIESEAISTELDQSVATTATEYFDLNFDITFNRPANIKGKIIANIPLGIQSQPAAKNDFDMYAIVKFYHVAVGGAETLLGAGTARTIATNNIGVGETYQGIVSMATCVANITTTKHFKKGEILRFSVGGWFKSREAGAIQAYIGIGHDPNNNATGVSDIGGDTSFIWLTGNTTITGRKPSRMEFHVPFRLPI